MDFVIDLCTDNENIIWDNDGAEKWHLSLDNLNNQLAFMHHFYACLHECFCWSSQQIWFCIILRIYSSHVALLDVMCQWDSHEFYAHTDQVQGRFRGLTKLKSQPLLWLYYYPQGMLNWQKSMSRAILLRFGIYLLPVSFCGPRICLRTYSVSLED